ncbi:MAG: hypothetical protein NWP97_03585, partial [Ilumatobacteraceae bacterium]|nr:hypothetical protein [Ilumatobacteraceae bacterium]
MSYHDRAESVERWFYEIERGNTLLFTTSNDFAYPEGDVTVNLIRCNVRAVVSDAVSLHSVAESAFV